MAAAAPDIPLEAGVIFSAKGASALTAAISTHFSLKAAYLWKFVNSPPDGFMKTDTTTSMSIIVNY